MSEEKVDYVVDIEVCENKKPELSKKYYDMNLEIIKEKHPHINKLIESYLKNEYISKTKNCFDSVYLANNEDGNIVNIVIKKDNENYLICDHINPEKQAQEWIETCIDNVNKIELIYGMGMGYHIDAIINKYPTKKIMIIEPSIELFIYILSTRDLSNILNKCWILIEESFDVFLKNFLQLYWDAKNKGVFKLQIINVYNLVFSDIWVEFRDKFKNQMNALNVDTTTRKILTELWLSNYIKNIKELKNASNCDGFLNKFKGIPAILVSAGASLEKNIHLLKDVKDKCLIMSASSARLSMKQFGVSPHLFFTVDASEGEIRIVKDVENENEYMVYSNQIYPESLKVFDGKKIFINYNSDFYTINFLNWAGIKSGHIMSAPSVANTCFDMLVKLGCNPIIFIGQDLSFVKNKQYAGTIDYGLDMEEEEWIKQGYPQVDDIYGEKVFTMPTFLAMKNCFEDQITLVKKLFPELDIINCTEGGIGIGGVRNEKLQDVIENFKDEINVTKLIEELYKESLFNDPSEKIKEFNKMLVKQLNDLEKSILEQKKTLKKAKDFKVTSQEKSEEFNQLLSEIDNISKHRESLPIYKLLLSPVLQVDLFQMGVNFVKENEHETNFEKRRKSYVETLRNQLNLILKKLGKIRDWLEEE